MNKEEFIGKLQMVYVGDKRASEEIISEYDRLNNIINEAINYIDDNTYYKDHKGHINIDNLYIILQKAGDKE